MIPFQRILPHIEIRPALFINYEICRKNFGLLYFTTWRCIGEKTWVGAINTLLPCSSDETCSAEDRADRNDANSTNSRSVNLPAGAVAGGLHMQVGGPLLRCDWHVSLSALGEEHNRRPGEHFPKYRGFSWYFLFLRESVGPIYM